MEAQNVAQAQQPEERRSIFATILRFVLFYYVISMGMKYFLSSPPSDPSIPSSNPSMTSIQYSNLLSDQDPIRFSLYLSEDSEETPIWDNEILSYNFNETNSKEKSVKIPISQYLSNNGTLWLKGTFEFFSEIKQKKYRYTLQKELTKYTTKALPETINLLTGEAKKDKQTEKIMHYIPSIEVWIVHDTLNYPSFPPQLAEKFRTDGFYYYPITELSDFWVLKEHLIPYTSNLTEIELKVSTNIMWVYKYMMITQFEQSMTTGNQFGLHTEGEFDILKKMFLETNPYFLGLTIIVSFVHMFFEMLALKSEVEFWRGREDLRGISTNNIIFSVIANLIIFLYLQDSGEASWAVTLPMGLSLIVDFWKITKGYNISFKKTWPFVVFQSKEANKVGGTKYFDNVATKYLAYVLIPGTIGYGFYSLYAHEHKSLYSWIVGTLASLIYTFGFIMMTPQLYINYKLKSVAHMNWKVLTYKALNTFIDDMFAFIIAMPTMHRLACFRDDIIFFIFLYQKWIYKVDPNRHYLGDEIEGSVQNVSESDAKAHQEIIEENASEANVNQESIEENASEANVNQESIEENDKKNN